MLISASPAPSNQPGHEHQTPTTSTSRFLDAFWMLPPLDRAPPTSLPLQTPGSEDCWGKECASQGEERRRGKKAGPLVSMLVTSLVQPWGVEKNGLLLGRAGP